ncbi:A/G-specific adenine glycosylase [Candidatus Saccharibacteria bacterium]|nr:A/G-specific adenine glycosylase [Candidatus Saccharibacteria bacterium]
MNRKERQFVDTVWQFWRKEGRHDLPWRQTTDPYRILVSEVMLQQTQVERVIPKYRVFMKRWGSARALARAPLAEVIKAWQGLGYNSRAKRLRECAEVVVSEYQGHFPADYGALKALPGIGPYTAGAVMAFAFNKPAPIIETNIRSVYLHHFFADATDVPDEAIMALVTRTLATENPREWYWALMDYGVYIKKTFGNPNSRSKNFAKQSRFVGSDRQIRGAIVRMLTEVMCTRKVLHKRLSQFDMVRIDVQLEKLLAEGMIEKRGQRFALPT